MFVLFYFCHLSLKLLDRSIEVLDCSLLVYDKQLVVHFDRLGLSM